MYWDVKTVKPLPNSRIYVEIEDGRKGIFNEKSNEKSEKRDRPRFFLIPKPSSR